MVSGAGLAHMWVLDGERELLRTIERDLAAVEVIRAAWDTFTAFLDTDTPPLVDADTLHRDDALWAQAALAYTQAKQAPRWPTRLWIAPRTPCWHWRGIPANKALV